MAASFLHRILDHRCPQEHTGQFTLCCLGQTAYRAWRTLERMSNLALDEFIAVNRDELIRRCRAKVRTRSAPPPTKAELDQGVPLFLDQLTSVLRHGPSPTDEISRGAARHGHDLLMRGFTVSQVVHDYGDVCQSVTDLAVEKNAPITADDFRTLNQCLDDAIAVAVTEYSSRQEMTRDGESQELRNLVSTALTAFEVLRTGNVGVGGSTAAILERSLNAIREITDRPLKGGETAAPEPR
jgi:hypothetical protein